MKKRAIRLLCAAGALLMLTCGAYALSSGDSLVTLRYLQENFMPDALKKGEKAADQLLQETYTAAEKTLDKFQAGYLGKDEGESGGAYSDTLQPRDWAEGDEVELATGSGVLMLDGTISVTHSGAVVDVTEGKEVASGAKLLQNHRYLVGEDTLARFTVLSGAARMGVQGGYAVTEGEGKSAPFYDVARGDWYYAPVAYVYENNLFSGMDANHFGPFDAMDRAMLMTVLYRMAGTPEKEMDAAAGVTFADVPASAWYAPYVRWGYAQGITAGTGPDTFGPTQQITRQQVVALLYSFASNYLGLSLENRADLSGYQDLKQADGWAVDAFSWAVADGVVGSSSADKLTLSPQKPANRAEVAAMLRAFAEKIL